MIEDPEIIMNITHELVILVVPQLKKIYFIQRLIQRTALSPPAHETALLQWMAEGP